MQANQTKREELTTKFNSWQTQIKEKEQEKKELELKDRTVDRLEFIEQEIWELAKQKKQTELELFPLFPDLNQQLANKNNEIKNLKEEIRKEYIQSNLAAEKQALQEELRVTHSKWNNALKNLDQVKDLFLNGKYNKLTELLTSGKI